MMQFSFANNSDAMMDDFPWISKWDLFAEQTFSQLSKVQFFYSICVVKTGLFRFSKFLDKPTILNSVSLNR